MSSDPNSKIETKEAAVAGASVAESETQSGSPAETSPAKPDIFADNDDPEWLEPPLAPLDRPRGKSTPSTSGPRGGGGPRPPPNGPRKAAEDQES